MTVSLQCIRLNQAFEHYMITSMEHAVLQFDKGVIDIDHTTKQIHIYENYKPSVKASCSRNEFMERCGFPEMNTTKSFEKYMEAGGVRDYEIVKHF